MQERWLSVEEIGAHPGVNSDTICKWLPRKKMPGHKLRCLGKFIASEVVAWIKAGKAAVDVAPASEVTPKRKPRQP